MVVAEAQTACRQLQLLAWVGLWELECRLVAQLHRAPWAVGAGACTQGLHPVGG